jgi:hypothetical protein
LQKKEKRILKIARREKGSSGYRPSKENEKGDIHAECTQIFSNVMKVLSAVIRY